MTLPFVSSFASSVQPSALRLSWRRQDLKQRSTDLQHSALHFPLGSCTFTFPLTLFLYQSCRTLFHFYLQYFFLFRSYHFFTELDIFAGLIWPCQAYCSQAARGSVIFPLENKGFIWCNNVYLFETKVNAYLILCINVRHFILFYFCRVFICLQTFLQAASWVCSSLLFLSYLNVCVAVSH